MRREFVKQKPKITPTSNQTYGCMFGLTPRQHQYRIQFAQDFAQKAQQNRQNIQLLDLGCGNGDMAEGIISEFKKSGFKGITQYSGADLDEVNLAKAKNRIKHMSGTHVTFVQALDLTKASDLCRLPKLNHTSTAVTLVLLCEVLHWMSPESVRYLLTFLNKYLPKNSYVVTSVCSVWNRTSIGNKSNPRQPARIQYIQERLQKDPNLLLWRNPEHIEYGTAMSHYTKEAMELLLSTSGFSVLHSTYIRNLYFPNQTPDLPENIHALAVK